jgi:putative membrane protein
MITWPFDPTVYAGLLALFAGYAVLSRSVDDARPKHRLYFVAGLIVLWVALESPIDTISDGYLDSVHMVQHVLLGFVAPPLMLLGLSYQMAGRLAAIPLVRALTEPVPAQIIAAAVMIVWHVPALYNATLDSEALHVFEHLTFIAAGAVLFWPVIRDTSRWCRWQMSPGARLIYLLVATIPQDGVALALLFSRDPFYAYYTRVPRLVPGLTPVIDQTLAGAALMVLGKAAMLVCGLAVFFEWFGAEHREDMARLPDPT